MGMIGNYMRVSEAELSEYFEDSNKLKKRIYDDENPEDENRMDVDKAWEGIFFLVSGGSLKTPEDAKLPAIWVLMAPGIIDKEQNLGYGPAFYTTPQQTAEVCNVLNALSEDELKNERFKKLSTQKNIYPEIWDEEDALEYVLHYFNLLKDFYNKAMNEQQGMIIFIN